MGEEILGLGADGEVSWRESRLTARLKRDPERGHG
jgi:hypothetical protein